MRRYFFTSLVLVLIFASWSTADTIIVITAEDPPGAPDQALIDHITPLGFEVVAISSAQAQPVDVSGAICVVIGEALGSSTILGAYKDVALPIVITETYILDDMQLAPDGTFVDTTDISIIIVDPDHPIAGGLTGEVEIFSQASQTLSTSDIQGDVDIIASTVAGDTYLAAYETGALAMDGVAVPAPRVYMGLQSGAAASVTDVGWGLFERAVLWSVGQLSGASVTPEEAIATTWGDLKAHY